MAARLSYRQPGWMRCGCQEPKMHGYEMELGNGHRQRSVAGAGGGVLPFGRTGI